VNSCPVTNPPVPSQKLRSLLSLSRSLESPLSSVISSVCRHFDRFQNSDLSSINFETLDRILSDRELKSDPIYFQLLIHLRFEFLSLEKRSRFSIGFDSVILEELPELFREFKGKYFKLLYREFKWRVMVIETHFQFYHIQKHLFLEGLHRFHSTLLRCDFLFDRMLGTRFSAASIIGDQIFDG
jgi:hypothetical protein